MVNIGLVNGANLNIHTPPLSAFTIDIAYKLCSEMSVNYVLSPGIKQITPRRVSTAALKPVDIAKQYQRVILTLKL